MKISKIRELLDAETATGAELLGRHVYSACASDMMSDVLAFVNDQAVLLTGLLNAQVIRTAIMTDMNCVVLVRNKKPTEEMIDIARDASIVILSTSKNLYESCGLLFENGLKGFPEKR